MKEYQSLNQTRWDCKYHLVFIPKRRKKRFFGVLRHHLGVVFHEWGSHKEAKIVEEHVMGDPVQMCTSCRSWMDVHVLKTIVIFGELRGAGIVSA